MNYETITVDVQDYIVTITFNRPEHLNAFNIQMIREFDYLWRTIRSDDLVRVIVITGKGRAFSIGRDAQEMASTPREELNPLGKQPIELLSPKWQGVWKPVIAAVNGLCGASGLYWVNEADIVIASTDAQFYDSHINIGAPALNEVLGLARRIPIGEATRLALLSLDERMSAQRAHQIGLVSEIVPAEELLDRARYLAQLIAAKSPVAVQTTVRGTWEAFGLDRQEAYSRVGAWRTGPEGLYPAPPRITTMVR